MFKLADNHENKSETKPLGKISKSVWNSLCKDLNSVFYERGIQKGKELVLITVVRNCIAQGKSTKEIADLAGIPTRKVRFLAKKSQK